MAFQYSAQSPENNGSIVDNFCQRENKTENENAHKNINKLKKKGNYIF